MSCGQSRVKKEVLGVLWSVICKERGVGCRGQLRVKKEVLGVLWSVACKERGVGCPVVSYV